jgi:hypothetical protein
LPCAQTWFDAQTCPHWPQLIGLDANSAGDTQTPLHVVCPRPPQPLFTPMHWPSTQRGLLRPRLPQLAPHAPQFWKLLLRSTHVAAPLTWQEVKPGLQLHAPLPSQYRWPPPAQVAPHMPQFVGSVCGSEQVMTPLLLQRFAAQEHCPFTHVSPRGHAVLQLPQWSGSLIVLVHVPPHCWLPAGQVHWPFTHDSPGLHWLPHWPQLFALVVVSTQPVKPPQFVCPATAHAHCPDEQICPAPQTDPWPPHDPQWLGSDDVSTQPAFAPQ